MTNSPILSANARRDALYAELKATVVIPKAPRRDLPKRSRSHSRKHRAIR